MAPIQFEVRGWSSRVWPDTGRCENAHMGRDGRVEWIHTTNSEVLRAAEEAITADRNKRANTRLARNLYQPVKLW